MTGQRPPPTTSKYQRHGVLVPRLAGRPEDAQRRQVVAPRPGSSPWAISARTSVGLMPRMVTAWRSRKRPQPVGLGEVGRALVEAHGGAVGQACRRSPTAP